MSEFIRTRHRTKLFPDKVKTNESFEVTSQGGAFEWRSGVGCRFELALFDPSDNLYDVGTITSANFVVYTKAHFDAGTFTSPYIPKNIAVFANISRADWDAGAVQQAVISLTADEAALAPGDYVVVIYGNTNDAGSPVDFCCVRDLKVLPSGIPTAYTAPASDASLQAVLLAQLNASLNGKADKIGTPGDSITLSALNTATGKIERIIMQAVWTPEQGLVFATNPEILP